MTKKRSEWVESQMRQRRVLAGFDLTDQQWLWILEASDFRCYHCGTPFTKFRTPTMDRIIPGKFGGRYTFLNVVASCRKCNFSRGAKTIAEFHAWRRKRRKRVMTWH